VLPGSRNDLPSTENLSEKTFTGAKYEYL
jgi:hypothetical protein